MEFNFKGKTILVTGAGQGIGKGVCLKLAKGGADVIAVEQSEARIEDLKKEIPNLRAIRVNLDSWSETRKALANIGHVDGIVNNAGVAFMNPFFDITESDFDRSFSVNVKAIINVTQMAAKGMVERKKGAVVNVSSQSSMRGHEDHAVYCSTKGAVDSLTRVMALELGQHNVRVNCVNPTIVKTPMGLNWWADPVRKEQMLSRIPLGRYAEVEEIANAILFLLSDSASMINGVTLLVDGGHCGSCWNMSPVKV